MNCRTECVVLRKIPWQESSLIVNTFTRENGRIDFMLKGVRSVGKKKFPAAELFRCLSVEFRMQGMEREIYHPVQMDLIRSFDGIALHTENYIRMCEFAQFLLKHTAPFLALPETFDALLVLLQRMTQEEGCLFEIAAMKLVFLNESGLLPENAGNDPEKSQLLQEILSYAMSVEFPRPELTQEYENRLISWVGALCRYHGLDKFAQ